MIAQLETLKSRYNELERRQQHLLLATAVIILITVFYLAVWEPIVKGLEQQQQQYQSQQKTLAWMQTASNEARQLKTSGSRPISSSKQPISLVIEQSASTSGLKNSIDKLESSGKDDVRVKLNTASFDQVLIWLNTLEKRHGVNVTSASIERADKVGTINARLSFKRS